MKTAYSYIRFSSKVQELGDSLRRQFEATDAYCKQHNLKLSDKSYRDLGISGFKEKDRASLADMLSAIEKGSITSGSYIIIEAMDRLSRQGIDITLDILKNILRNDITIVLLSDNLTLTKASLNDLTSMIKIAVAADFAHKESVRKSERVKEAKDKIREKSLRGEVVNRRLPFWLSRDGDKYILNDKKSAVEMIIELRKCGTGFNKIAQKLNDSGYKARTKELWHDRSVAEIVKSKALYGAYQQKKPVKGKYVNSDLILDYYPAMLTFKEFQSIQSQIVSRAAGTTRHNHLAGIARCACCSSSLLKKTSYRSTKSNMHVYHNWLCRNARVKACKNKGTAKDLDKIIIKAVQHLKIDEIQDNKIDKLSQEIEAKTTKLNELTKYVNSSDEINVTILGMITSIEKELSSLKTELESKPQANQADLDLIEKYIDDPVNFNIQLKMLVSEIKVTFKSRDLFHVRIVQHNGNLINITAFRKTQRSEFQLFIGDTEKVKGLLETDIYDEYDQETINDKIIEELKNELFDSL
jgi:DNA invertase Pin-like site-specific DNA recombinase